MNFTARVASRASQPSRTTSILRSVRTVTLGHFGGIDRLVRLPGQLAGCGSPPLTAAEARAVIEQLETDSAAIDQQYAGVKEEIKQGRAQLKLKQADVKAQTDMVARMKLQVGQVALAQFQNRSLDTAAQLFVTPTPIDSSARSPQCTKSARIRIRHSRTSNRRKQCLERRPRSIWQPSPRRRAQIADRSLGQEDRTGEEGAGKAHRISAAADLGAEKK